MTENQMENILLGNTVAKSFSEILKFNPYHDRLGRFATGGGFMASGYTGDRSRQAVTFSANPDTRAGAMAIARASNSQTGHELIGRAYGLNGTSSNTTVKPRNNKTTDKPQKETKKPTENKPKSDSNNPSKTENNSKSVLTQNALDKCKAVEAKTVNRKTEKMTVIDDDGNVTFEKSGGKGSVRFTTEQAIAMSGKTITHNHPGEFGGTFSPADVSVFTEYGLKSIRAVAKEGTYSLEKTENATLKSGREFRSEYQRIANKSTREMNSTYRNLKKQVMSGEMSADDANKKLFDKRTQVCNEHHKYIKRVAESYGYRYYYEPTGGVTKMYKTFYDLMKTDNPDNSGGDVVLDDDLFTGDNWKEKLGEFK